METSEPKVEAACATGELLSIYANLGSLSAVQFQELLALLREDRTRPVALNLHVNSIVMGDASTVAGNVDASQDLNVIVKDGESGQTVNQAVFLDSSRNQTTSVDGDLNMNDTSLTGNVDTTEHLEVHNEASGDAAVNVEEIDHKSK